jgi:hypothetical protein
MSASSAAAAELRFLVGRGGETGVHEVNSGPR